MLESLATDIPRAAAIIGITPATRFHLQCRQPLTRSSIYLYLTFEPCNSVLQTLLCPPSYLSRVFCLSSLISSRSRGVSWIVGPSSILVQCFSWKGGHFHLVDGSTSCVLRSRTIHLTPLITLTFVMSFPQFSFNLISVSKLTRTLNCSISFFSNYCLIQDLLTKQIIGRECESRGLYILDTEVLKFVTCFGVVTPFELHCRLNYPSLPLLK